MSLDNLANLATPNTTETLAASYSSLFGGNGIADRTNVASLAPGEEGHYTLLSAAVGSNGGAFTFNTIQTNVVTFG
jgi:hypothetical protein